MKRVLICLFLFMPCSVFAQTAAEHFQSGEAALKAGNVDAAIFEYKQALSLKPTSSDTKDRLIASYEMKISQLEAAVNTLKSATTDATKRVDIRITGQSRTQATNSSAQSSDSDAAHDIIFVGGKCTDKANYEYNYATKSTVSRGQHWTHASGTISNRSGEAYYDVLLYLAFFDRQGKQIDTAKATVGSIAANGRADFSLDVKTPGCDSFVVTKIEARK